MKLEIRNCPLPLTVVRAAVNWYADKLMGKRLSRVIAVKIQFIDGFDSGTGEVATCIWEDDNHRPREFSIEIDTQGSPKTILQNLAHEMVHVKQMARGELKDLMCAHSMCKWMGTVTDADKLEYYDYPWEIEAFGREFGLYTRWRDQYPPVKAIIGKHNEKKRRKGN